MKRIIFAETETSVIYDNGNNTLTKKRIYPPDSDENTPQQEFYLSQIASKWGVGPEVIGFNEPDNSYTMEKLEGMTLNQYIQINQDIWLDEKIWIVEKLQILLDLLGQSGLIHNDLHPKNIFVVTSNKDIKLLDWGYGELTTPYQNEVTAKFLLHKI